MTREWTEEELAELEDPEMWDWEKAEVLPRPPGGAPARVSVSFTVNELELIDQQVEQLEMTLTDYIRESALVRPHATALLAVCQELLDFIGPEALDSGQLAEKYGAEYTLLNVVEKARVAIGRTSREEK